MSKSYAGVSVLRGVDFTIASGEVVALMGENGAGKSTLVKILTGVVAPDSATFRLDGDEVAIDNPRDARQAGIGVIHQHFSLVPELSIYENLFMGREASTAGFLARSRMRREAQRILDELEIRLKAETKVSKLTVGQCQLVEICKATLGNPWLIIMDEPTSSLSQFDCEHLYGLIHRLVARNVAILYISHKMAEIFKLCSRAVVLRDGDQIGEVRLRETDESAIVGMMVGRTIDKMYPYAPGRPADLALCVKDLSDGRNLKAGNLEVRRGEVVALAGLIGSGRSELLETVFGLRRARAGSVEVFGRYIAKPTPSVMSALHVAFVPEDRHSAGFVPMLTVGENMTLRWLRDHAGGGFIPLRDEGKAVARQIRALNVRPQDPNKEVIFLSGGNQQKVVLGKWLLTDPELILLDEPTRGIDVGAKAEIHALVGELKQRGVAVLMVSSELPEVLGVADRIVVMHEGRTVGELPRETTEEEIMNCALGLSGKG